jgi:ABC-2 type transport system permease protein
LFSIFGFILIFPLITMRLFAEEFKMGTIETLMTAPVRDWEVVLSKFMGAVIFYLVLLLPSLLYFELFQALTRSHAAEAAGAYWGAYLIVTLLGTFYISVGCLASVLTSNQVIAAVISFCSIAVLFYSGLFAELLSSVGPVTRDLIAYLSAREHIMQFSQGIIDSRPLVFYSTMTVLMLTLTHQVFQSRRWKL